MGINDIKFFKSARISRFLPIERRMFTFDDLKDKSAILHLLLNQQMASFKLINVFHSLFNYKIPANNR